MHAICRGKVFDIGDTDIKIVQKAVSDYSKGIIVVCENCSKVDINPFEHFANCSVVEETYRQDNLDNYYK